MNGNENKYYDYYLLLNHWLEAGHYGHSSAEYFEQAGMKNIAIYGMGDLANRLMEELKGTDITVAYGIDRDAAVSVSRIGEVYSPQDQLAEVDAVIVTPITAYECVKDLLQEKMQAKIISFEEVIWSI